MIAQEARLVFTPGRGGLVGGRHRGAVDAGLDAARATFPRPLVIAQHLDPRRTSRLGEILARAQHAARAHRGRVASRSTPGTVFVVPGRSRTSRSPTTRSGSRRTGRATPSRRSTCCCRSAAEQFGEQLIAVILTGTGSTARPGRARSTAAGRHGRDPGPADARSYPAHAAVAGADDGRHRGRRCEAIGPLLHDLLTGAYAPRRARRGPAAAARSSSSCASAAASTSPATRRRPSCAGCSAGWRRPASATWPSYIRYLQRHPEEYQRLVSSFLIKVTEFFRDPELFAHLREAGAARS